MTAALTPDERLLLNKIGQGHGKKTYGRRGNSEMFVRLAARNLIRLEADGNYTAVEPPGIGGESDLIWLPNAIVTGTNKGEDSPLRRLRSAGDIWAVRLFIDLYHAQNLRDDGGISPGVLQQQYMRELVGEQGIFTVWAFKAATCSAWWKGPFKAHQARPRDPEKGDLLWQSVQYLQKQGLVTFVPHLWDNDFSGESAQAEIIHSYGGAAGEPLETAMGDAAHQAAVAMVPDFKREKAVREGYYYFAPVLNTLPNVQMIGVARLRYRPHTSRTSDWYGELARNAPRWVEHYRDVREPAENAARKLA